MLTIRRTLGLALIAAAVLTLSSPAMAKRGRGRGGDAGRVDERVHLTLAASAPFSAREATLRMRRRKGVSRQEMKVEIEGAPTGRSLDLFIENGSGSLSPIAGLREKRVGTYVWRVRTRKGGALPFGAADIAELSGRDVEIRTASGDLVYFGTAPAVVAAPAANGKLASLRTGLAVDDSVAEQVQDGSGHTVHARIRVERNGDREELRIQVEHAVDGLLLTAYMDDGTGALAAIGDVTPDDDGEAGEYRLRFRTDRSALPFGVESVSELAGRAVEVRLDSGDVFATGTVPAVGAPPSSSSSGTSGDDSGSDDDANDDNGGSGSDDDGDDDDADEDGDGDDGDDDDGDADEDGDGDDDDGGDDNGGGN